MRRFYKIFIVPIVMLSWTTTVHATRTKHQRVAFALAAGTAGKKSTTTTTTTTTTQHSVTLPRLIQTKPFPVQSSRLAGTKSTIVTSETRKISSFRSECRISMDVYIEDTDAYGVLYYGNYLRSFERALHMSKRGKSSEMKKKNWYVTKIDDQKYRSSPVLGQSFTVLGSLLEENMSDGMNGEERWSMVMKESTNDNEDDEETAVVYNSAIVTLSSHPSRTCSVPPLPETTTTHGKNLVVTNDFTFVTFPDDYDPSFPDYLSFRSILNYFERSRTLFLGGPETLRKMKDEDGVVWVVTSLREGSIVNDAAVADDNNEDTMMNLSYPQPGDEVMVRISCEFKRRGVVECRQTLFSLGVNDVSTRNKRLAQAVITIWALDAKTFRPTAAPKWFLDSLHI